MGTPAYMSPEQGEGIPSRIGAPADVWSMGVVWYEALTNALPFEGPTPTAILLAVNAGKFTRLVKRLPTLPVPIANAIDKAIVRDVSRRYADMGAFLDALLKAAAEAGEAMPGRTSAPGTARASRERVSPAPQPPAPEVEEVVIELGPVDSTPPEHEVVLGDTTDEPVVLLRNPRKKRRRSPLVAVGVAIAALAAVGVVAFVVKPTLSSAPEERTAALRAQPAAPVDASAPTRPETPHVEAPVVPVAAVDAEAPAAPVTTSRHGHHSSRSSTHDGPSQRDDQRAGAPPTTTNPTAATPPDTAPPQTAQTPSQTEPSNDDTRRHHGRHDGAPVPRENAPLTDYDPSP